MPKIITRLSEFGIERNAEIDNCFFKQAIEYKNKLMAKLNKVSFFSYEAEDRWKKSFFIKETVRNLLRSASSNL